MHALRLVFAALILLGFGATATRAQVPPDLEVIGIAGSTAIDDTNDVVRILANGQGTFERFVSGQAAGSTIDSSGFTLTPTQVQQLWDAIQVNGFFSLAESYQDSTVGDRTFAQLLVTANATSWTVTTQNVALPAFDNIVAVINALTPDDDDLIYDTSPPPTFTSQDVCNVAIPFTSKHPSKDGSAPEARAPPRKPSGLANDGNPGTRIAYHISLQEAVNRGIATLAGKGGYFGDQVSITVDNSACETSDTLQLTVQIELYGPGGSAAQATTFKNAIENLWGGFTTGGKNLGVEVKTRASTAASPPGTAGYHQIKADTKANIPISFVSGLGSSFTLNQGVGSGSWQTTGSQLNGLYAHEAGHLFALPDRYHDYRQQADGSWRRRSDGDSKTTAQLATLMMPSNPTFTHAQIVAWLNRATVRRATFPHTGSLNDIMAKRTGSAQQSDIDAIAAQAGLVVEVRPGDILVNKDGALQNFIVTRTLDMFIHKGKTQTLNGVFVACIDASEGVPSPGGLFDVALPLSSWVDIDAAQHMQAFMDYIDEQELFCGSPGLTQQAIWRLSDNSFTGGAAAEQLLIDAGVDVGSQILDFPRLSNPNAGEPTTTSVVPPELYALSLAATSGDLVQVGQQASFDASLSVPPGGSNNFTFAWSLTDAARKCCDADRHLRSHDVVHTRCAGFLRRHAASRRRRPDGRGTASDLVGTVQHRRGDLAVGGRRADRDIRDGHDRDRFAVHVGQRRDVPMDRRCHRSAHRRILRALGDHLGRSDLFLGGHDRGQPNRGRLVCVPSVVGGQLRPPAFLRERRGFRFVVRRG